MSLFRFVARALLGKRLPVTRGRIRVDGLDGRLEICRDGWGVPHIRAVSESDAWYALGFCQGQDRAFQLESLQRLARGTLSEIVGPEALQVDRLSRRVGFFRAAKARLAAQRPEELQVIRSFVLGVNDGRSVGLRRRPHEMALLRATMSPFAPEDPVAILSLMSFLLAANWDIELARLRILSRDGVEALKALDPAYPDWLPTSFPPGVAAGTAVDRLQEDLDVFTSFARVGGGSNIWAVNGSRSATGRPVLANDPHLPPVLPSPWYLAHLRTPDWQVAGASFVGDPGIGVGHNGHVAWGLTAGQVDNTDLFLEDIGPDGRSARSEHGHVACEVVEERIRVRGQEDLVESVLLTPRGPVISPAFAECEHVLSLRATWLDPGEIHGMLTVHLARDCREFRRCFSHWPAMSFNLVCADVSGSICGQIGGDVPLRRKSRGTLPLPAWAPEVGWEVERVPFDELPHALDPECGFVVSANNQPSPPGVEPFLGADFLDGYRAQRIGELLTQRTDWDLERFRKMQLDVVSIPWREMRSFLLESKDGDESLDAADVDLLRQARGLLESWNGELHADSSAASLFEFFLAELSRRVVEAKAPNSVAAALGEGFHPILLHNMFIVRRVGQLVRLLREQPDGWFDEGWPTVVAESLARALRSLRSSYGRDPERWRWGELNAVTFLHPFGEKRILRPVFNRGPYPLGGDGNTIAQAAVDASNPARGAMFVVSLRMIVDVGNWDASRFVLPGGQSGNPFSPHYDDQLPLWLEGRGIPMPWSDEAVDEATREVLSLESSGPP